MSSDQEIHNLQQLLNFLDEISRDKKEVSLEIVIKSLGGRSFGFFLIIAGIITVIPLIGDIPGVPTLMGIFVILTTVQLFFHNEHFWLPQWLLKRSVSSERLSKTSKKFQKPANFIDKLLRQRLQFMVGKKGLYLIASVCLLIALAMPPMELIPFSANGAGAALVSFGLALIARDGLLALAALIITLATFALIISGVF